MVLYPNKLPESERVCFGICNLVISQEYPYLLIFSKLVYKSFFINLQVLAFSRQ